MSGSSWLITDVDIIDADGNLFSGKTVLLAEGSIGYIADSRDEINFSGNQVDDLNTLDGRGKVLTPGLINLHTHSPMNIFKGIAEDVDADTWFNRDIWPYESKIEPGDIEIGALLAAAEMINCGVTAYADHYFAANLICRIAEQSGLRLDMAPTLFGLADDFSEQLEAARELHEQWDGTDGRVSIRVGPHSPYTCSPKQLKMTKVLAEELDAGIHLHVSETDEQVQLSIKNYGRTPFQVINDCGLFEHSLIIGHGVHITDLDREMLVGSNTHMAICPKTYLKLGTGVGNILKAPEQLPLAIGTDGAASSNTLNPLEQARLLALLGKNHMQTGAAWDIRKIWKVLMNGHNALPFGTGKVEPGAPADLVLWNLNTVETTPVHNPLTALLYSANPSHAEYVWVKGCPVKKQGVVQMDTNSITIEARDRALALVRRGRGETDLVF